MRVSIRRTLRVHEREGTPLEDLGVIPDYMHKMTKEDVLNGNIDLINNAASILVKLPVYKVSIDVISSNAENITVKTETENISRLDILIDDRPQISIDIDIINNSSQFVLKRPLHEAHFLEVRGFKDGNLIAVRRVSI
jgi:hypothetical protein